MNCLVETYDQIWSGKKKLNTVYVCVNFKISLGIFLSSLIKKKSLITYLLLIKWIKELANWNVCIRIFRRLTKHKACCWKLRWGLHLLCALWNTFGFLWLGRDIWMQCVLPKPVYNMHTSAYTWTVKEESEQLNFSFKFNYICLLLLCEDYNHMLDFYFG